MVSDWTCDECKTRFDRSKLLERHAQETRHAAYRCSEEACNKTFRARPSWLRHEKSHTNTARYICSLCNKIFQRKDNFDDHESRCLRRVGRRNIHEGIMYYDDLTEQALDNVLSRLQPRTGDSKFRCPIPECGQLWTASVQFRHHLLVHIVEDYVNHNSPIAHALDGALPTLQPQPKGSRFICPLNFCTLYIEARDFRAHLLGHIREMAVTVLEDSKLDLASIGKGNIAQTTKGTTVYAQDTKLAQDTNLDSTSPVLPQPSLAVASLRKNFEQDVQATERVNAMTNHSTLGNDSLIGRVLGSVRQSPIGSLMSWKPMSWSSLSQHDTKMTSTTPSSYDVFSSSQLVKAEAKHMSDYVCCGNHFKTLHELMQHHEVSHAMAPRRAIVL